MSTIDLERKLIDLTNKERVLETLRDLLLDIRTLEEIKKTQFLTREEVEWFFSEIVKSEKTSVSMARTILDRELARIRHEISTIKRELMQGLKLIIFPKWRDLVQAKWMGAFKGRVISRIIDSKVILLSSKEITWQTVYGRDAILILGPGVYYCKFYLKNAKEPITYSKLIHGVLMLYTTYETALSSPPKIVSEVSERIRQLVYIIDFRTPGYNQTRSAFISRIYSRIFSEEKEVIREFFKMIRTGKSAPAVIDDVEFLSALPETFNKILITEKKFLESPPEEIEGGLPGLVGYDPSLLKLKELSNKYSFDKMLKNIRDAREKFLRYSWDIISGLF
ncbi:MAG: hypothetical protein ACTSX9_02030 [Candidatus Njordarchaeales archaeon]